MAEKRIGIFFGDFYRGVRGVVIDDNQFGVSVRLVFYGLQTRHKIFPAIFSWYDNGDEWQIFHQEIVLRNCW
jgi:hypothetical protein